MALLAPYHDGMKLGSGFNSFTQELCLDGAVVREDGKEVDHKAREVKEGEAESVETGKVNVAQSVSYKTSIIDKVSDIFDTMNINAAFTVKFSKGSVNGGADFLNISKIKNSDLTFMVSCKVTNQTTTDSGLTRFSPVAGLKAGEFPRVYGDSFISGFQEGGDFTAVISIRAKDRAQANTIKADAAVILTFEKANGSLGATIDKIKNEMLSENETTVSVTWTGGGQGLKKPEEDWTFDTMRAAALKFPHLVSKCPIRTHAVLTKYSSLKSFYSTTSVFKPLAYEGARVYTSALRDAFLDYQNIAKGLSVLALDVNAGTQRLVSQKEKLDADFGKKTLSASVPNLIGNTLAQTQAGSLNTELEAKNSEAGASGTAVPASFSSSSSAVPTPLSESGSEAPEIIEAINHQQAALDDEHSQELSESDKAAPPKAIQPLVINALYPATIYGLESARMQVRFMMNRIVAEVENVATHPEIATDETRPLPYMSPWIFNMLLPTGLPTTM